ncbi:putative ADP-ribosylation factor GTPase-activating protein AGD14 isoform X2 [Canna indica]|uniref:ADP-ribosylation factor GTPase-activating protein AGD14 isoform X2 n=1 Tax=Canna indica TaxID=4628 RepID=A0AAQ3QH29_9LILI|nr:putative ADP-ribosylation factor GTPase-activating protein AGD14 isoform X2 [Canna indica]
MASRVKEDEKNEKIIRGLLKLPANRRCINCNSLGPQYVCTNFWTFICINCSGIHREFTHRVKSISMAKFTSLEVSALQEGGNERAKEIYFKEWDQQRHSFPDSRNIDRLREFIKHVYVDRRFAGSFDRPPRVKGVIEDSYDKKKVDSYQASKSPPYDDADGRQYGERSSSLSPPHSYRTSPGSFDRDNNSEHRSQDRNIVGQQFLDAPRLEGRSSNQQKDVDASKFPVPRPVGSVSNVPPATVGESTKSSGLQFPHSTVHIQSTASSNSRESSIGNSVEQKVVSSGSLIDFDADPVPPLAVALDQSVPPQDTSLPAQSGGWASFDDSSSSKTAQIASVVSTAESILSQLSVPQTASPVETPSPYAAGIGSLPSQSSAGHWRTIQQHQTSLFQTPNVQSIGTLPYSTLSAGTPENHVSPSVPGLATALTGQHSQVIEVISQSTSTDVKPTGRIELPADLFTAHYPSSPFPYYQTSQHLMSYGMHYPAAVAMPTYSRSPASVNPFALADEPKLLHASTFPNLSPLQGALPNVDGHSSILRTSSLPTQQWFPQQQIPISAVSQIQSSGSFVVQQGASPMPQLPPNPMFPVMHQTIGVAYNFPGSDQRLDSRNYRPHTPNSFTPGGNPFG